MDRTDRGGPGGAGAERRPIAVIDGRSLTYETLRPRLIEAAGPQVLEEAVLDVLLVNELERQDAKVTNEQLAAERALLSRTLLEAAGAADASDAARMLADIRAARGLGEVRFDAMVRRNAMLRALVAPEVRISPGAIDQAYEMRYGTRFRARLITVATAPDASAVVERARSGEDFATLASQMSTDTSAARGGLLAPISPADASYPMSVRRVLTTLKPGEVSDPVTIDNGFAVLQLVERVAAESPPERAAVEPELEAAVRLEQERLLMNQLARRLLDNASISILDRGLEKAWRGRAGSSGSSPPR